MIKSAVLYRYIFKIQRITTHQKQNAQTFTCTKKLCDHRKIQFQVFNGLAQTAQRNIKK